LGLTFDSLKELGACQLPLPFLLRYNKKEKRQWNEEGDNNAVVAFFGAL